MYSGRADMLCPPSAGSGQFRADALTKIRRHKRHYPCGWDAGNHLPVCWNAALTMHWVGAWQCKVNNTEG